MKEELIRVAGLLREAKDRSYIQDYALIGGLALSAFAIPRATKDIDILVVMKEEEVTPFYKWLKYIKGYPLTKHYRGKKVDYIKHLIEVPIGSTWADILVAPGRFEERAVKESVSIRVFNRIKIKVVPPEYLLILKLISGSDQDYIDCAQLWKVKIDKKKVRELAKETYTEKALARVIGKL